MYTKQQKEKTMEIKVTKGILDQVRSSNLEQLKALFEKYEGMNFWIEEAIYKRLLEIVSSN